MMEASWRWIGMAAFNHLFVMWIDFVVRAPCQSPEDRLAGKLFLDVYFGLNSYNFERSPRDKGVSLCPPPNLKVVA